MGYITIPVKPGSPEWHQWRKRGLGASLAPVIMGDSPYQTSRELASNRLNHDSKPGEMTNYAMSLGHQFESEMREIASTQTGMAYVPDICVQHDKQTHFIASLDGYDPAYSDILEIKYVGRDDLEKIKATRQPLDHHRAQLIQQMYIMGRYVMTYAAFTLDLERTSIDEYEILIFSPPATEVRAVIFKVNEFWNMLQRGELPEPGPRDPVDLSDNVTLQTVIQAYGILQKQAKEINDSLEFYRGVILNITKDIPYAKAGGVTVRTCTRKGSINYKSIPELKGVDLEKYRQPDTTYRQIRGLTSEKED